MISNFKLTSFENASIIRKFTIFYFLASIIPLGVLDFLYLQLQTSGQIEITEENLRWTIIFVVAGVTVGYGMMRAILLRIVEIAQKNASTVAGFLGPRAVLVNAANKNEIEILTESFQEITSRLEENVRNLEAAKQTLHAVMAKVGAGMSSLENIDSFLNLILETVTDALQAETGVLLLAGENDRGFYVKAAYGKKIDGRKRFSDDSPGSVLQRIIKERQTIVVHDLPQGSSETALIQTPALCAPLLLHDRIIGIIVVSKKDQQDVFDDEEKNILGNLALQTAVAVENSRLNEDAEKTYFETISALAMAVDARDPYSRGHSDRVANYAIQIAEEIGRGQEDITILRDAAKLHDLGKIGVLDQILKKEGPLNPEEMEMMKKHSEIGEGIIKPIRSLRRLCDIVRHHHEKLDGSGYPDGLKGDAITPLTRILTVADIFDAVTTSRPYREPLASAQAITELRRMKTLIDQSVVDALEQTLR